ncbi:hypothetical protein OIU74_006683 [Salix koriyanagi]|uniref:Uncharacterized protein n=1 Tax=Salix koriyanagi TaxID=2511006 RepID=A0A9Q0ZBS0_9ROSI|nr:hypothetical protein OIU74_006683 [Salix koriyanagi]
MLESQEGRIQWRISHPPPLPLILPPPLNYSNQTAKPPPPPFKYGYQNTSPLPPRASVPQSTNESSMPRNKIGYSGSYGVISGGRADSFQNYGFVDPYGRANSDGENTAGGGSATSGPCWSKMEEPSHEVAKRTSSSHTAILEVTRSACRL